MLIENMRRGKKKDQNLAMSLKPLLGPEDDMFSTYL